MKVNNLILIIDNNSCTYFHDFFSTFQNVTISLPGSKRGSRQPSVDREGLKRSDKSSSMEIFTGIYEIKVPHPSNMVNNKNKYDSVNEIHTDTIR